MASRQENELLTQIGPGTPCGELMRRYWQPAALSEELPPGAAPVPVRLLGEDLVLFRDDRSRPGLLGMHCSHRGADLSYGRLEDGGIRCIYHGWLYDVHGKCLEQPGEPAGSTFHERIRHPAYPCQEVGGLIYAYLGPGDPPPLPPFEFVTVPADYRINTKVFQDCNYLQGNEGNIDPVHLSFLHRMRADGEESAQAYNTEDTRPIIEVEETAYGLRIYCVRSVKGGRHYVRVTNYLLPNASAVSGTSEGYTVNWHVPIDDTHHWRHMIRFSRTQPMDQGGRWMGRSEEVTPDYHMVRSRANRYLQDRESMKTGSFCGLGSNFLPHDTCATEGPGPIQARTQEHLGYTDKGIFAARKVLIRAIHEVEAGSQAPRPTRDDLVARSDVLLPASVDWHSYWENAALETELTTLRV